MTFRYAGGANLREGLLPREKVDERRTNIKAELEIGPLVQRLNPVSGAAPHRSHLLEACALVEGTCERLVNKFV